jgi:hypothetical protein
MDLFTPLSQQTSLFIDLFIFFAYVIAAGFIIYIGRKINYEKKITLSWIVLATGFLFISVNLLIEVTGLIIGSYITTKPVIWYLINMLGSIFILIGFAMSLFEKIVDISILKKRKIEIRQIMDYLDEKYRKRELTEEDLRKMYSKMVEELAEVEVKLKGLEKKKK